MAVDAFSGSIRHMGFQLESGYDRVYNLRRGNPTVIARKVLEKTGAAREAPCEENIEFGNRRIMVYVEIEKGWRFSRQPFLL